MKIKVKLLLLFVCVTAYILWIVNYVNERNQYDIDNRNNFHYIDGELIGFESVKVYKSIKSRLLIKKAKVSSFIFHLRDEEKAFLAHYRGPIKIKYQIMMSGNKNLISIETPKNKIEI